jgi:CRP-like cAMP-binding protein
MSNITEKSVYTEPGFHLPYDYLLPDDFKVDLYKNLSFISYHAKDIIFRQNTRTSHVMLVKSGYVKIFKEGRNDKNIILKLALPGNFIGLLSVFGEKLHQYSASAISECEICEIDISIFRNMLIQNSKYSLQLLNTVSLDGLFIFEKLLSHTQKQLPGRIADVILYFSDNIYNSHQFTFPFTRQELAELAGTTKESFIRTLSEFKNDKIISMEGSDVEIISMDIIKTLSALG